MLFIRSSVTHSVADSFHISPSRWLATELAGLRFRFLRSPGRLPGVPSPVLCWPTQLEPTSCSSRVQERTPEKTSAPESKNMETIRSCCTMRPKTQRLGRKYARLRRFLAFSAASPTPGECIIATRPTTLIGSI